VCGFRFLYDDPRMPPRATVDLFEEEEEAELVDDLVELQV
jgi:hypothetical protein